MTDVLAQMPGVAIDQNQQIHVRDTEGPQFQYQINGVLVPLDINTNPPFLSMINPLFVKQLVLLDGVLPVALQLRHWRWPGRYLGGPRIGCVMRLAAISPSPSASARPSSRAIQFSRMRRQRLRLLSASGLYEQGGDGVQPGDARAQADPRLHQPRPGFRLLLLSAWPVDEIEPDALGRGEPQPAAQRGRPRSILHSRRDAAVSIGGDQFLPRLPGLSGHRGAQRLGGPDHLPAGLFGPLRFRGLPGPGRRRRTDLPGRRRLRG